MKNILVAGLVAVSAFGLFSCERQNSSGDATVTDAEDNKAVVNRDTIVTEYEVEETVVEYDTTTRKRTVDANKERRDNN